MENESFYLDAYKSFEESFKLAQQANFLPLPELRTLTSKIVRVYTQLVPEEVRDSFTLKVSDLEDFLKARESAERIIATSMARF